MIPRRPTSDADEPLGLRFDLCRTDPTQRWPRLLGVLASAILAAACATSTLSGTAPAPTGTPSPGSVDEKREAAQGDARPPRAPTQRPWRAEQPSDILENLPHDLNFDSAVRALTSGPEADPRAVGRTPILGTPLFVRGLGANDRDEFLVPLVVDAATIAVMVVPIGSDGTGELSGMRGWSLGPSFPAQSAGDAVALAGLRGQPAVRAELVWTDMRGTSDELTPFWRIENAGRAVSYVFEDGRVLSASAFGSN